MRHAERAWNFAIWANFIYRFRRSGDAPGLNFAVFATLRVGMLEAGPKPVHGCEGQVQTELGGWHKNANERREDFVQPSNCPTQAKPRLNVPPILRTMEDQTWRQLIWLEPGSSARRLRSTSF